MTGLVKAKKYDWRDSNLALFGSDTEKQVKKEAAETEPAWQGAGEEVGLKVWRIVKFEVKDWPEDRYGEFYSGDSYIVLNTYKEDPDSEALSYDVHFWIGKHSTQDEYGTAAYKTVELDTYLNDAAVQHREVQSFESALFKGYFKQIVLLEGGADTGFRHVEPESYSPRLLHFSGTSKNIVMKQVPLCPTSLNSTDVFILDLGKELYQFNGEGANKDEKFKAAQFMQQLKSDRGGVDECEVLDEADTPKSHKFFESLTGEEEEGDDFPDNPGEGVLLKVSDEDGSLDAEIVKTGNIEMSDLQDNDVFIVDFGNACYTWIGSGASVAEKKNALAYTHNYLKGTEHPYTNVTVMNQGKETKDFHQAMAA